MCVCAPVERRDTELRNARVCVCVSREREREREEGNVRRLKGPRK